jgi:hypothetical protein
MKTLTSEIFRIAHTTDLNWVIFILVSVMVFLVVGKLLFAHNFSALGNLERFIDINDNQGLFGLSFQLMFALLLGALLVPYFTDDYDFIFYSPLIKVVAFTVILLAYFLLRSVISRIGVFAFKLNFDQKENQKIESYYMVYAVGVLFLSVLIYYFSGIPKPFILIFCVAILFIINIIRIIKNFGKQQKQETKSLYYNILYLCALEILPLLVLFKFLTKW